MLHLSVKGNCFNFRAVQEYFVNECVPVMVPAPEWVNGCPTDLVSCCEADGYKMFKGQCYCKYNISQFTYQDKISANRGWSCTYYHKIAHLYQILITE